MIRCKDCDDTGITHDTPDAYPGTCWCAAGARVQWPKADEPAPREVDVGALRRLLSTAREFLSLLRDRTGAAWTTSGLSVIDARVHDALALLDAERREPPGLPALPDGWREVERDDDHVLYESDTTFADFDRRFGVEAGGLGRRKSQPTIDEMSALVAHYLAVRKAGV